MSWSTGEVVLAGTSGQIVVVVEGINGENWIRVEGATPREAWHPTPLTLMQVDL
jgi:hypothetical protein